MSDVREWIREVDLSVNRKKNGLKSPTLKCRYMSERAYNILRDTFGIEPYKIEASVTGGIYLVYGEDEWSFKIDIDNDLSISIISFIEDKVSKINLVDIDGLVNYVVKEMGIEYEE